MDVISEIGPLRAAIAAARQRECRIGCVPTMGALHAGHFSLMEECRKRVDYVVATIFVNPSQFAPTEDLSRYPRPLSADLAGCRGAGVDVVFTPEIPALYPPGFETWVSLDHLSSMLEGEIRPTHFRGVATIVAKLFNIVQPDVACFGAKDFQQQALIRQMVRDLDFPVEVVVCETVREPDGLALSSRNVYLSADERRSALSLSQALRLAEERFQSGETSIPAVESAMWDRLRSTPLLDPQYAVVRDPESLAPLKVPQPEMVALIAAKVGQTRLIDNRMIRLQTP